MSLGKILKSLVNMFSSKDKLDREQIIEKYSEEYQIPADLIRAIIKIESNNNKYAVRYERRYEWLYEPENYTSGLQTLDTEKEMQKTSWGLMQIMGALARELGFEGIYLSELVDPDLNIKLGTKHLANLYEKYDNYLDIISAYNQGSPERVEGNYKNQRYVDLVNDYWEK